jgi:hypothetical protein
MWSQRDNPGLLSRYLEVTARPQFLFFVARPQFLRTFANEIHGQKEDWYVQSLRIPCNFWERPALFRLYCLTMWLLTNSSASVLYSWLLSSVYVDEWGKECEIVNAKPMMEDKISQDFVIYFKCMCEILDWMATLIPLTWVEYVLSDYHLTMIEYIILCFLDLLISVLVLHLLASICTVIFFKYF